MPRWANKPLNCGMMVPCLRCRPAFNGCWTTRGGSADRAAGVGKTAALRQLTQALNPPPLTRSSIWPRPTSADWISTADWRWRWAWSPPIAVPNCGGTSKRVSKNWSMANISCRYGLSTRHRTCPTEFFRDLACFPQLRPSTPRDLMSIWLVGHPALAQTLDGCPMPHSPAASRPRVQLNPIIERERFEALINHAVKTAGCTHTLLADLRYGVACARHHLDSPGMPDASSRLQCSWRSRRA